MARANPKAEDVAKAFVDYERAKQMWEVLAGKHQKKDQPTIFPLDQDFLKELGFTKEDRRDNLRDLQAVLNLLEEFTWHWDRNGPLSSKPGEPSPVAYVVGGTLILGPHFHEARTAFVAYAQERDRQQRRAR